ncbi:MAG: hypothetical protein ACTS8S_18015, partial [Giesbergeria sp.]
NRSIKAGRANRVPQALGRILLHSKYRLEIVRPTVIRIGHLARSAASRALPPLAPAPGNAVSCAPSNCKGEHRQFLP